MSQDPAAGTSSVIRITKSDADSQHVQDLLKRQASLRGETGISRDTGRRWYYQNWFVLMFAGLLSAVICWAILRPFIRDRPYLQGSISAMEPAPPHTEIASIIKLGGQTYPIVKDARELGKDGKWGPLNINSIHEGQMVGIHITIPEGQRVPAGGTPVMYVSFIDPHPPASSSVTDDLKTEIQRNSLAFMLFFPLAAGLIGLGIGAADGIICRLPRRILLAGAIGLIVGLIGGFVSSLFANIIYGLISEAALKHRGAGIGGLTTVGFLMQIGARSLGWTLAGTTMGLGQGLALRSGRVIIYGLLGGLIGGLFGGILFDPIDLIFHGDSTPYSDLARLVSISVIGASVGAMIGIVELLARDAWLRMVAGPLAGKEFLIFKNTMNVGSSPKSDIYLFNDPGVAPQHATLRATGDTYEIESTSELHSVTINGRAVRRSRLRHGDQIGLGRTVFVFQRKTG